jgi:hypothetical protein
MSHRGRQRLRRTPSALNIVMPGNSLISGAGQVPDLVGLQTLPDQVGRLLAAYFSGAIVLNRGHGGYTYAQLEPLAADEVDAAFLPGRTNVMILWETTNTVTFGATPAANASAAQSYIQNRLAVHPSWIIVIMTTIPRQGGATGQAAIDTLNANLLAADALIKSGYRAWGAKALIDVRQPGSPFRLSTFTTADFAKDIHLWNTTLTNPGSGETNSTGGSGIIHLSNLGYGMIAAMVMQAILALPSR